MGRRWIIALLGLALVSLYGPGTVVRADDDDDDNGNLRLHTKAAHSLFFTGSTPADTHMVCGLTKKNKPYTLNISGSANVTNGSFFIRFRDGDTMGFNVPAGSTYSTTHALGGVPDVDTPSVMINQEGGVNSMMASVLAKDGGKAFCTHCTGGSSGATGTAGTGDPAVCNFP
jgi:hypothetical protein